MSFELWLNKAERCLATAHLVLEAGDTSAACNRAYYAMFNAARAALIAVGQERLSAAKTHSGVISAFGQFVVNAGKIDPPIAKFLGKDAHLRLVADYEGTPITVDEAKDAIREATLFLDAVVKQVRNGL